MQPMAALISVAVIKARFQENVSVSSKTIQEIIPQSINTNQEGSNFLDSEYESRLPPGLVWGKRASVNMKIC